MNYKQLLILSLSNITKYKNEAEMIIPEEMREDFGWHQTCELLGDGKYILRRYWKSGNKLWEKECQNNQQHGQSMGWYESGNRHWKIEYQNGLIHGKETWWSGDGIKWYEAEYENGNRLGITFYTG